MLLCMEGSRLLYIKKLLPADTTAVEPWHLEVKAAE